MRTSAEFLAPLIVTWPRSGEPPQIREDGLFILKRSSVFLYALRESHCSVLLHLNLPKTANDGLDPT